MRDTGVRRVRSLVLGLSLVISIFILSFYLSEKHGIVNAQTKDSCVTDKCHSKMGKEKFVHGPAAVGDCMACHAGDAGKHRSSPASNKFAPIKM